MIAFSQLQVSDGGIVDCREQCCLGILRKTKITPAVIALLFNESSNGMHLHAYLFPINLGPFFPVPFGANCLEHAECDTATLPQTFMHDAQFKRWHMVILHISNLIKEGGMEDRRLGSSS